MTDSLDAARKRYITAHERAQAAPADAQRGVEEGAALFAYLQCIRTLRDAYHRALFADLNDDVVIKSHQKFAQAALVAAQATGTVPITTAHLALLKEEPKAEGCIIA